MNVDKNVGGAEAAHGQLPRLALAVHSPPWLPCAARTTRLEQLMQRNLFEVFWRTGSRSANMQSRSSMRRVAWSPRARASAEQQSPIGSSASLPRAPRRLPSVWPSGFAIVSAIGGLAQNFDTLVSARALQGMFGAHPRCSGF
jgi:hypothetical protein